jgi:hypothetical protein
VISATGFSPEQRTQSERSQEKEVSTSPAKEAPTPAEELASAIFQFVSASNFLSSKMEILSVPKLDRLDITSLSNEAKNATPKHQVDKDADTHDKAGGEVQLLRMRTKRQELIIFPDTKFLCCVIQAVGKAGQSNGDGAG